MADKEELLWVCACRDDDQVIFYEVDERHPGGSAVVAGKTPTQIAMTGEVARLLRDPENGLKKLGEGDLQEWQQERETNRSMALAGGAPAGFMPTDVVAALRAEIEQLRAEMGRAAKTQGREKG